MSYVTRATCIVLAFLAITSSSGDAETARQIAQQTFPSVVLLILEDANGQPRSLGSGFFIRADIVATNLHVLEGASSGYARIVGQKAKRDIVGVVATDQSRDLVLLKISGVSARALPLGNSRQLAVGEEVYAVGNPQGLEGTFSQGIVSGIRTIGSDTLLQITAPISPGSSGGPVLNTEGRVIGVAAASFRNGQNLNFAIPAAYLEGLLAEIKNAVPLSATASSRPSKSLLSELGGRSTEGVLGAQFAWQYPLLEVGTYSFSLRNQLRQAVSDVRCVLVFYDANGSPLDVSEPFCRVTIPAGLAKRMTGEVDGSVQRLARRIDIRILDFKIRD